MSCLLLLEKLPDSRLRLSDEFLVIPDLSEEVIIGVNTLQKWRIKLDFELERPVIEERIAKLIMAPRL